MKYHPRKTWLLLGLLCVTINLTAGEQEMTQPQKVTQNGQFEWAHLTSDIPADKRVIFGQLPNGLRYAIMQNSEPRNRVYLRMCVASGSFNETECQRGLAHFLEHMVFNGSKNFPEGMNQHFQRLGLEFGRDVNAYTSFESTVYRIDPPQNTPTYLKDSLLLFRDYADGALLKDDAIEAERGVILSEKRDREDAQYRAMVSLFRFIYPGTIVAERFPIGTTEVISKAPSQSIRDYYYNYYSADRIMITVVGDILPCEVEKMIKERFSDLHSASQPNRYLGTIPPEKGLRVGVHIEPEIQLARICFVHSQPYQPQAETLQSRSEEIAQKVVMAMFNLRMERLSKQTNATFSEAGISQMKNGCGDALISSIIPKKNNWEAALSTLEQELRRVQLYGFTPEELATVKAQMLSAYKKRIDQAPSAKSEALADMIYRRYQNYSVISTPLTDYQIADQVLANLDVKKCHEVFKTLLPTDGLGIFITSNEEIKNSTESITKAYEQSKKIEVTPPKILEQKPFAYQDFGTPGKVVLQKEVKDLGITQIKFSNNVILNLKKTDFEKGKILVSLTLGKGLASLPHNKQGLNKLAEAIFLEGALKEHDINDLERIFAGKTADIEFKISDTSFDFNGVTIPSDLTELLQLITAYITAPGFRPEALNQYHNFLEMIYKQNEQSPMGVYQNQVTHYLSGNDPRFGFPPQEKMAAFTEKDLQDWLLPQFKDGTIEIGIVGDIDVEKTIQLVAKTLGALPTRQVKSEISQEILTLTPPWQDQKKTFQYVTQEPKGLVSICWPTPRGDKYNIKQARRISLLGEILNEYTHRVIREEAGAAYSPFAFGFLSRNYNHFGYMTIIAQVDPEKSDEVLAMMQKIGNDLAEKGFSDDEFIRVHKPRAFAIRDQLRKNSYWLTSVVTPSQTRPEILDWCRNIQEDTMDIKKEELLELAKEIFSKQSLQIKLIPKK